MPPNKEGTFHQADTDALPSLGKRIDNLYKRNYIEQAEILFSSHSFRSNVAQVSSKELNENFWEASKDDLTPTITINFSAPQTINTIILGEYIPEGQLIEAVVLEHYINNQWEKICGLESIGYRRIIELEDTTITNMRIVFKRFRKNPTLNFLSLTFV